MTYEIGQTIYISGRERFSQNAMPLKETIVKITKTTLTTSGGSKFSLPSGYEYGYANNRWGDGRRIIDEQLYNQYKRSHALTVHNKLLNALNDVKRSHKESERFGIVALITSVEKTILKIKNEKPSRPYEDEYDPRN